MSTRKEKAPDAGQGVEGIIPEGTTDMSNTVTQSTDTLPVISRDTITRNRAPLTATERAFAFKEGLARLETRYILSKKKRDADFKTPEGDHFRSAGDLYIRTCRDGVRRFTAYMHDGSVDHDFRYFDQVIRDAMNGRMDGWKRHTFKDGDEGWIYNYSNYRSDGLTFKPALVIIDQDAHPDATMLVGYGETWGFNCEEPRCREKHHTHDAIHHTLDELTNQLTKRGSYEIEICKDINAPDGPWYVNFWSGPDLTELTPEQIATLANDLQWMGLEAATTNAKEPAA